MYSKHKDAAPEATVERIREIYRSINLTMDCRIEEHIDGIYSAYIHDIRGGWSAAGKGTTQAYCLASAYGESIEHVCNHFAFDISKTSDEAKDWLGFRRYPDETWMPIENIRETASDVYRDMERCFIPDGSGMTIEEVWQQILGAANTPFIPYYSVARRETILLPDALLSKMCGSNGGGSGNTPEEAIGHALDEVIERYVKYRILYDHLTPPTVPREYIQSRCPDLYDLIGRIEKEGGLTVIVKDASLGKGYSVICILVINPMTHRYLSNFGAHPCFEIALERCLTELFQDHDCVEKLLRWEEMTFWNDTPDEMIFGLRNWVSLLRDDIGILPDSLFGAHPSWKFEPWPIYRQYTNKIGMCQQIDILRENGFDVYIRDNSFLGFPVYKIYVPFASLSHLKFDCALVEETEIANHIYEYLEEGITPKQERILCDRCFGPDSFMLDMVLRHWSSDTVQFLHAAALFDSGRLSESLAVLENSSLPESVFLRRYIQLTPKSEKDRDDLLRLFFGKDAEPWLKLLARESAFSMVRACCAKQGLISNMGAASADRDALYKQIKEAFAKFPVEQMGTAEVIG